VIPTARSAGIKLGLTKCWRSKSKLWTVEACDETPNQGACACMQRGCYGAESEGKATPLLSRPRPRSQPQNTLMRVRQLRDALTDAKKTAGWDAGQGIFAIFVAY
jgi:hypothetical protein